MLVQIGHIAYVRTFYKKCCFHKKKKKHSKSQNLAKVYAYIYTYRENLKMQYRGPANGEKNSILTGE